jgi:hypothetical protein
VDGSWASGGEGCFRLIPALALLASCFVPVSASEHTGERAAVRRGSVDSVAVSMGFRQLPDPATMESRRSIHTPVLADVTGQQVYRCASCPTQAVEINWQLSQQQQQQDGSKNS